ncbi:aspartate aminotransferase [Anaeramoeba flamelloides]|uniref:Aspartate aminotransferase n=1 Tax=Anaeramoeba flamelloides TaxID=1746091 RepID=A0AAV7YN78_9EUKA|nr:aspartate aminotransferase [Anaeramoeba flamelloides]
MLSTLQNSSINNISSRITSNSINFSTLSSNFLKNNKVPNPEDRDQVGESVKLSTLPSVDPIGHIPFLKEAQKITFGRDSKLIKNNEIVSCQANGGTNAIWLGLSLLQEQYKNPKVYISAKTWGNHKKIVQYLSDHRGIQMDLNVYPWTDENNILLSDQFFKKMSLAEPNSIVVLHACCHNLTGIDLKPKKWKELAQIFAEKKLHAFFDMAYQGLGSGDLDNDAFALRYFAENGVTTSVAESYSKKAGLYGARLGVFHHVLPGGLGKEQWEQRAADNLQYFSLKPSALHAEIMYKVLSNNVLFKDYKEEIRQAYSRIQYIRNLLSDKIEQLTDYDMDFCRTGRGLFTQFNLDKKYIESLQKEAIFLLPNGRISLPCLNRSNIDRFVQCIIKYL